jgi:hypothetical protein
VLEFDQDGKLLAPRGGPGQGYEWPSTEHGIFVDAKDNVWLAGRHSLPWVSPSISQISSGRDHGWIDIFLVFRNNGSAVGAMIQMIALVVRQRH